jgi:transposase
MQRLQAFKFELMPDGQQQRQMRRFAGSCRFVFNKALALQKERHEQGEKKLGYAGLCKLLTEATQARLNAAPERRRNPLPLGRGGCQRQTPDHTAT